MFSLEVLVTSFLNNLKCRFVIYLDQSRFLHGFVSGSQWELGLLLTYHLLATIAISCLQYGMDLSFQDGMLIIQHSMVIIVNLRGTTCAM
ncbi:MAG: hypothetical protein [Macrobrachium rosenbergii virus 2]|nr:MAG: hypothetical protein [Macrobrachium rosenbergii virus 2]